MPRAADQAFDRVRCRERLSEPIGQAEREDGEGLVETFTDTRRSAGVLILESAREILQETTSGSDVDLLVGTRDDRADPGPLAFRKMLQNVAEFVTWQR